METRLLRAFVQIRPDAIVEPPQSDPQLAVDRDCALLDAMLSEQGNGTRLRLWTNSACIVIPQSQVTDISLERVKKVASARGFGVALRRTGGAAVIHRPGIMCVSLLDVVADGQAVSGTLYTPLLELIGSALERLDIPTDYGSVAGSYCDGKWNVRAGRRKIAGTAAHVRRRHGLQGALVHAALTVWGDLEADVAAVCEVESILGRAGPYSAAPHTSVYAEMASSR